MFYHDGKPRHERFAQLLFFSIASSYCEANNLEIPPESDAGAGPVDFKFSIGREKVIVEIKLSTNSKVVSGYKAQIEAYAKAERASFWHYVLIDVGGPGRSGSSCKTLHTSKPDIKKFKAIHLIDGELRASASLLQS